MISTMSTSVLVLFAVAALLAFAFPLIKERVIQQMKWLPDWGSVKSFAGVILPFLVLLGAAQFAHVEAGNSLRWFALAAIAPFLVSRLNMPPRLTGVLVLALTVVLTKFFADAALAPTCFALIAGLTVWKAAENLLLAKESSLEDILPSLIWLVGINWITTALPEAQVATREGLLLGILSVTLILRLLQGPFIAEDKVYLKRIVLALSGGLFVLLVIMKLILSPGLSTIAALFGAAVFLAYILDALYKQYGKEYGPMEAVTILVLVGIFTLVASRLFGNFGLLVLAPAMLVAGRAGFAHTVGLFFVARALLQGFVLSYVPNVTGINLTHPYASAALYGGFLSALLASLALRDLSDRRWLVSLFLAGGALVPLCGNYFLHEEPTGSFLTAASVAAILMAVAAPALYRREIPGHENIVLLPVQMVSFALLGNEVIALGNQGTGQDKLVVLAAIAVAVALLSLLLFFTFSRSGRKPVEVPGD